VPLSYSFHNRELNCKPQAYTHLNPTIFYVPELATQPVVVSVPRLLYLEQRIFVVTGRHFRDKLNATQTQAGKTQSEFNKNKKSN
jgi:hypothetical protein